MKLLRIKDPALFENLLEQLFDPLLVQIVTSVMRDYGGEVVTAYRDKKHLLDPHGDRPCRAMDLAWPVDDKQGYEIIRQVNGMWRWNARETDQVASARGQKTGSAHIHIQVSDETQRR